MGLEDKKIYNNFDELVNDLSHALKEDKYVFRGYSQTNEIYPTLIRNEKESFVNYEIQLLEMFEQFSGKYRNNSNPMDFFSCAQHYGIPTCLLDFTYNPFKALAFALWNEKREYKIDGDREDKYYFIDFTVLNEHIVVKRLPCLPMEKPFWGSEEYPSMAGYVKNRLSDVRKIYSESIRSDIEWYNSFDNQKNIDNFAKLKNGKLLFVLPDVSNERIYIQQGLFMVPWTIDRKKYLELYSRNILIIRIHSTLRKQLLNYLDGLGHSMLMLMPDLSSVCTNIKKEIFRLLS